MFNYKRCCTEDAWRPKHGRRFVNHRSNRLWKCNSLVMYFDDWCVILDTTKMNVINVLNHLYAHQSSMLVVNHKMVIALTLTWFHYFLSVNPYLDSNPIYPLLFRVIQSATLKLYEFDQMVNGQSKLHKQELDVITEIDLYHRSCPSMCLEKFGFIPHLNYYILSEYANLLFT